MTDSFKFDVFLSHSSKDKATVRQIAERLRNDGLKVWFDEWALKTGEQYPGEDRGRVGALTRAGAMHVGECVRFGLKNR